MPYISRDEFEKMNEADLRQKVLMPLLEKMGYRDVHEWHSAVMEQGKDILAWKETDLGERTNTAVVAKAFRLSGKAVEKAAKQVRQAFDTAYNDPATHELQQVHTVWVVTNGVIPSDATPGFWSDVDQVRRRHVTLYDGDKLWKLWEKHFPPEVFRTIHQVQERLKAIDSEFAIEATITPEGQRFSLSQKYPGQLEEHPIQLSGAFSFPKTPEGLEKLEEVQRAIATGSRVTIPGEYVQFAFPDRIAHVNQQLFGQIPEEGWLWEISSANQDYKLPIRIDFIRDDGKAASILYVELRHIQSGTEEATMSNFDQSYPIKVKLRISKKDEAFDLSFTRSEEPISVYRLLEFYRVIESLHLDCAVRVESLESGVVISHRRINASPMPEGLKDNISVIEDLIKVQDRSGVPIFFPASPVEKSDLQTIDELREILHRPVQEVSWTTTSLTELGKSGDEDEIIKPLLSSEDFNLQFEEPLRIVTLFGCTIPIGRVRTVIYNPALLNESEVRAKLAAAEKDEIEVELIVSPRDYPGKATITYLDWLDEPEISQSSMKTPDATMVSDS